MELRQEILAIWRRYSREKGGGIREEGQGK
jgi:hypothetical protein